MLLTADIFLSFFSSLAEVESELLLELVLIAGGLFGKGETDDNEDDKRVTQAACVLFERRMTWDPSSSDSSLPK